MPRGGWRGGGRPTKAAQAAKAAALAEAIKNGPKTSLRDFAQGVLDSPASSMTEKMRACELLATKLSREEPTKGPDNLPPTFNIWSLPRGCQIGKDGKTVLWPDGSETDPKPVEPFEPTPSWSTEASSPPSGLERLEVVDVPDDGKVARLHPLYGRTLSDGRRLAAGPRDLPDDDNAA
jgi:hypothetical protein